MAKDQQNPREKHPKPDFPAQEQQNPGSQAAMTPKPDSGSPTAPGLGRLKDRVALITGADSGIGRAVAVAFAREGADILCAYLNEHDDARETCRLVKEAGRKCALMPGDLANPQTCSLLVERVIQDYGRLDILVNNAAYQRKMVEKFEELDAEGIERTFRVNILSMFHLVKAALPHLKPGASIINTGSIQAYQPSASILDYATTKGAIVTFSKGLAQSLAPRGIRVNCVAPGPVWTPLVVQSFPAEKNAEFGKNSPMGRPAQPSELAGAYVFLASDDASYVSGEVLGVTGGKPLA